MHLGVHCGIDEGGYVGAAEYAGRLGCTSMQIFTTTPRGYRVAPIDRPALDRFRARRAELGIVTCAIHTSYLINLASEKPNIYDGSIGLIKADLKFAAAAGIDFVNTHLGSYGTTRPRSEGFAGAVAALEQALDGITPGVHLVLENSAGAGQLCGGTLEELGEFVRALGHPQLGICLDTAHSWAAGYDISTAAGVDAFLEHADKQIGIERVKMFHFNDTQVPLGGARDRHHDIGDGLIGFAGFRGLAAHAELRDRTAILETPARKGFYEEDDGRNLATIRRIFEGARV
jgi:deoxyribonuclease-4